MNTPWKIVVLCAGLLLAGFIAGLNVAILYPRQYDAATWKIAMSLILFIMFTISILEIVYKEMKR